MHLRESFASDENRYGCGNCGDKIDAREQAVPLGNEPEGLLKREAERVEVGPSSEECRHRRTAIEGEFIDPSTVA